MLVAILLVANVCALSVNFNSFDNIQTAFETFLTLTVVIIPPNSALSLNTARLLLTFMDVSFAAHASLRVH